MGNAIVIAIVLIRHVEFQMNPSLVKCWGEQVRSLNDAIYKIN